MSTTYYVSPTGNDAHAGTTSAQAWQSIEKVNATAFAPGDRVLFAGGETFRGTVCFDAQDGGIASRPILVSSFGEGRAIIDGGTSHGITIDNTIGIIVRNINVKGDGRKTGNLHGVGVLLTKVQNAIVDQVDASGFQWAGLEFRGCRNLRMTHVDAHDNGFSGIFGSDGFGSNRNIYLGYSRVINNPGDPTVTDNHSGNGILFSGVDGCTIEFCEATENGWDMQQINENGPVGIWVCGCNNVTIQYCISHHNKSTKTDGCGFDFDGLTTNCVLQYNYSYENWGAGVLLCAWDETVPCKNNVVRYNILENDGQGIQFAGIAIYGAGWMSNTAVYNNIIYNENGRHAVYGTAPDSFIFWNNIFVMRGKGKFVDETGDAVFVGNAYWNYDGTGNWDGFASIDEWRKAKHQEILDGKPVGLVVDPKLTAAGKGEKLTDPTELRELFAYMLLPGSPMAKAGVTPKVPFTLPAVTRDFYGNPLPDGTAQSLGVHED